MKALTVMTLFLTASVAQAGIVEAHLHNIQDRVRSCTVLPYTVKHGQRQYLKLVSHCPEVQIVAPGRAKIKIGSTTFQAVLIENPDTDGDLYDLAIREPSSGDTYRARNILAFGDILLGVVAGNTAGIKQTRVAAVTVTGQ